MPDRLVLLGSKGGPALRPGGPWPSSSLLEIGGRTIVVDCGLGVTRGLVDAGISLKALDLIFITHLHSDHVVGLPDMWLSGWVGTPWASRTKPTLGFGPTGTRAMTENLTRAFSEDIRIRSDENLPAAGVAFDARDIESAVVYDRNGSR